MCWACNSGDLHDAPKPVQSPLVEDGVPPEEFGVQGKLAGQDIGIGACDVESCCCMEEVEDVHCLSFHFDWGFFIEIVKTCLEHGDCILGLPTVDEEWDKEEGNQDDLCSCGGTFTIGDGEDCCVGGVHVHDFLEIWAEPCLGVCKVIWC